MSPPDAARYRQAFRQSVGSVWVITAAHAGQRSGLTATSVVSLSADPAQLLFSISPNASSFALLQAAGRFGVNLLAANQQAVAERFSGSTGAQGEARYADAPWRLSAEGVWLLDQAVLNMACDVSEILWRRTQAIVIGSITGVRIATPCPAALVYADGRYTQLTD